VPPPRFDRQHAAGVDANLLLRRGRQPRELHAANRAQDGRDRGGQEHQGDYEGRASIRQGQSGLELGGHGRDS
jgi:hypothetical protein